VEHDVGVRLGEKVATYRSADTGRLKSAKFAAAIPAEDRILAVNHF
jgi:hypothetical protein